MVNELHLNFLKYFAIFGLVPYMEKPMQQRQQQHAMKRHAHHQLRQPQHHGRPTYIPPPHHHNDPSPALRWQQIYTVALIVANLITTLYGVIYMPFEDTSIVSDLVSVIVFVIQVAVVSAILLETVWSYEQHHELIDNLHRVQMLMRQLLQTQLCVQTIRQRQRRKYVLFLVSLYGCLIVPTLVIIIKNYYGYFWHALVSVLILRTRCLQMLIVLDYIYYYLEMLNRKLKALVSCKISGDYLYLDVDYRYLESYDYLENFQMVYQETYSLHNKFNDIFGLSLVGILTVVVLDITIHLYWTLLTLMSLYEKYYLYVTTATMVPLCTIVLVLCYTAEQCEQQCNLMLTSLKSLIKTSSKSCPNAMDYNSLLQDFIMQILHNPIRISANDYFTLNLKFLMGICANIVTYLVILLQFRKTSSTVLKNPNMTLTTTTTESSVNFSMPYFNSYQ